MVDLLYQDENIKAWYHEIIKTLYILLNSFFLLCCVLHEKVQSKVVQENQGGLFKLLLSGGSCHQTWRFLSIKQKTPFTFDWNEF